MQLILLVETRSSCESDYHYIKSAIGYFYVERVFKLSKIFAKTKSGLMQCESKINMHKSKYDGDSVVVICADYDREDDPLNKELVEYCLKHSYELVWMNSDVEEVFLGKQIPSKKKKSESFKFLTQKDKILQDIETINIENPLTKHPASNLLNVLDRYLIRKT